jgi:hypothetical protein
MRTSHSSIGDKDIDSSKLLSALGNDFGDGFRVVDWALFGNDLGFSIVLLLELFGSVDGLVVGVVEHCYTSGIGIEEGSDSCETDTGASSSNDAVLSV